MVGSRHLQGTIISRVKYLLESGSLKKAPLWYDVVRRFPPPKHSLLSVSDTVEQREVPKITYPEDDIKREFFKKFDRAIRDPDTLLTGVNVEETKTKLFLCSFNDALNEGKSEDDAFNRAVSTIEQHLRTIREQKSFTQEKHFTKKQSNNSFDGDDTEPDLSINDFLDTLKK